MKLAALVLLFTIGLAVHAQSPREQLNQMVEQLQKSPNDNALRERIIKLAQEVKPPPANPEEARRPFVRGNAAMSEAKTPDDYGRAAKLYEEALVLAPWWADPYFNLAKARELRQEYDAAIRSLRFYLLAGVTASEAREAQDRIYVLEEKASARQREKEAPQALAQQLQSRYGNRRITSQQKCGWGGALTCDDSEAQGSTWAPGARDGSYSWMPMQKPGGGTDFTSLNRWYQFRPNPANQNEIILVSSDPEGSVDWLCGSINGAEIKDIKWRGCRDGSPIELVFTTAGGRPAIDLVRGCDAARKCGRDRRVLE